MNGTNDQFMKINTYAQENGFKGDVATEYSVPFSTLPLFPSNDQSILLPDNLRTEQLLNSVHSIIPIFICKIRPAWVSQKYKIYVAVTTRL